MTKEYTQADGRALMIVPGLAFSDTGYRIGYGKGFYDRYLSSFTKKRHCYGSWSGLRFPVT